eukprot:6212086-Pleurochrysis_carterae.AAC.5
MARQTFAADFRSPAERSSPNYGKNSSPSSPLAPSWFASANSSFSSENSPRSTSDVADGSARIACSCGGGGGGRLAGEKPPDFT